MNLYNKIFMALLLTISFISTIHGQNTDDSAHPVFAARVKSSNIGHRVETVADILPFYKVDIYPETGGRITEICCDVGDSVEKEQVLAKINDKSQKAAYEQAQAAVTVARAGVKMQQVMQETVKSGLRAAEAGARALKTELNNISTTRERLQNLFDQGAISRQKLDDAVTMHNSTMARLDAANAEVMRARDTIKSAEMTLEMRKAELIQAEANLNAVKVLLDQTIIRAPFTGVITARFADPGAQAAQAAPIFSIEQLQPVKVVGTIIERYLHLLQPDKTTATISVESVTNEFDAVITRIHPVIDKKSRTIKIELQIPNENLLLRSGMFAKVKIALEIRENAVVISRDSLIKHNGEYSVYVIENQTAVKRRVKTGMTEEDRVEIIEGLSTGELIVAKGLEFVREGSRISIVGENGTQ